MTNLIEYLQEMRRDDAVELLRPVEFTGKNPVVHRQKLCKPNLIVCSILVCVKARLHRRFFSQQLDAIFVALKLQLQNRTCKPGAIFTAICRRDIAGVSNMFET